MRKARAAGSAANGRAQPNGREVPADVLDCAKEAGLRYVSDDRPGITRKAAGKGWQYIDAKGKRIADEREITRINRLAIPPAWTEVWICPLPNGHLQATGRDQRRRKQYRYHEDWRATRDATKYERMVAFGATLPRIRRRVAADLRSRGLGREKVLAAIVRLLESTLIRVGNEEYARDNQSYGLTTLRNRHVRVTGGRLRFEFTGKSGRKHEIDLHDPRLAGIVDRVQELPGQELFGYVDDDGGVVDVKSDDVNAYLREIAGGEFSAKDFRTWSGTVMAAMFLAAEARVEGRKPTRKTLTAVVKDVSNRLGNTPSVCRKCYIHPGVMESYLAGEVVKVARVAPPVVPHAVTGLSAAERAVLAFLRRRARQSKPTLAQQLERSVEKAQRARPTKSRRTRTGMRSRIISASRGSASTPRNAAASLRSGRDLDGGQSRAVLSRRDATPPARRRAAAR